MLKKTLIIAISILLSVNFSLFSQTKSQTIETGQLNGQALVNGVSFAVPFMTIDPESRGGAMGDAGVATSPDANSMHWNPAKLVFIEGDAGGAVSYTPWLRNLVGDIDLLYLTGYYRLKKDQVVAASLRYFSLGDIQFTDNYGAPLLSVKPNEYAFDAAYSRMFGERFSGAFSFRYIRSALSNGVINNVEMKPGQSAAADISMYYIRPLKLEDKNAKLSFGFNISNIGNKMTYSSDQKKDFIPTNLKVGSALLVDMDENNSITITADVNKFLVPSRPVYWKSQVTGKTDTDSTDLNDNKVIKYGKDPNVGILTGMIQSFYDSPGEFDNKGHRSVFKGELDEVNYSLGLEYWYRKQFAIRTGYFHESQYAGNRKFITMGLGLKLNVLVFDFSYLLANSNNPLANTLRFTISFNFNSAPKSGRK